MCGSHLAQLVYSAIGRLCARGYTGRLCSSSVLWPSALPHNYCQIIPIRLRLVLCQSASLLTMVSKSKRVVGMWRCPASLGPLKRSASPACRWLALMLVCFSVVVTRCLQLLQCNALLFKASARGSSPSGPFRSVPQFSLCCAESITQYRLYGQSAGTSLSAADCCYPI